MNKVAVVLGVAAVATLAGCKDPDYVGKNSRPRNEVRNVDTAPVEVRPIESAPIHMEGKPCPCAPGTLHVAPCPCGRPDCKCIVRVKVVPVQPAAPVAVKPVSPVMPVTVKPAESEATVYVVQPGDYLAKISKKFNVTINSLKRVNPTINPEKIYVGQKLNIPGKHDVPAPVVVAPVATAARPVEVKKAYAPYGGSTREYIVKSGDTLGSIAYGNGCTIRQLKELNGLGSNNLRAGQKLLVPGEGKAVVKAEKKAAAPAPILPPVVKAEKKVAAPAPVAEAAPAPAEPEAAPAAPAEAPAPAAESEPAAATYVVQEGDDLTGVSIRWGVSAAAIRELNNLSEDAQLTVGQIIKVPADAQQ